MSYLGLNLDSLCWELKALMKNNYDRGVTKENFDGLFDNAKNDILESFKDIIEDNRPELLNDFEEEFKEQEENDE